MINIDIALIEDRLFTSNLPRLFEI